MVHSVNISWGCDVTTHCINVSDITDECLMGSHNCDVNADCVNTADNFTCVCKSGFLGNGTIGTCLGEFYTFSLWGNYNLL